MSTQQEMLKQLHVIAPDLAHIMDKFVEAGPDKVLEKALHLMVDVQRENEKLKEELKKHKEWGPKVLATLNENDGEIAMLEERVEGLEAGVKGVEALRKHVVSLEDLLKEKEKRVKELEEWIKKDMAPPE